MHIKNIYIYTISIKNLIYLTDHFIYRLQTPSFSCNIKYFSLKVINFSLKKIIISNNYIIKYERNSHFRNKD